MSDFNWQSNHKISSSQKNSSFLDVLLTSLIPTLLITRNSWLKSWREQDELQKIENIKKFSWCIFLLFLISSIPIFLNDSLQPKFFWIVSKVGTALIFLITALSVGFVYRVSKMKGVVPMFLIGTVYLCMFQALSINYRAQTPYFYVPVFAAFSVIVLRFNLLISVALYFALLSISNLVLNVGIVDSLHKWSVSTVVFVLLLYLRLRSKDEVEIFILQQESVDSSKKLIEAQKNLTDQIAAFLPKEIYRRVMLEISKGQNPINAIDNQLRPQKVVGSVLFTDIRGFTKLTKKGDETLLKVVIPTQKRCTDIVEQNFGIPRLHGDLVHSYFDSASPIRNLLLSLKSSLEIDTSTNDIRSSQTKDFLERYVIISYGNLLVGNFGGTNGSRDISVLGDAANIPSRIDVITKQSPLKEHLQYMKIILTEEAWNALPDTIRNVCEHIKFNLYENNLVLKDFENEKLLYLLKNTDDLMEAVLLELNKVSSLIFDKPQNSILNEVA